MAAGVEAAGAAAADILVQGSTCPSIAIRPQSSPWPPTAAVSGSAFSQGKAKVKVEMLGRMLVTFACPVTSEFQAHTLRMMGPHMDPMGLALHGCRTALEVGVQIDKCTHLGGDRSCQLAPS